MRKALKGNAMMEYGLSGVLLLTLVGSAFSQTDWVSKVGTLQQNLLNAGVGAGGKTLTVEPLGSVIRPHAVSSIKSEQVCFASGTCVDLPVIPAGATVADTTGAMGGELTESFSSVMTKLAEELAAKGADPILVQLITDLANSGHNTARYVKNVEALINQYDCDIRTCTDEFVPYKSLWTIARGMREAKNVYYGTIMAGKYTLLNDYLANNPDVTASFPEAKAIIDLEYKQIGVLLDGNTDYGCSDPSSSCSQTTEPVEYAIVPKTTNYYDSNTGETVSLVTYYSDASKIPLYETVTMNGVSTTYKIGLGNVRTVYTDPIPATITANSGLSMVANISNKTVANTAELIHQDSNVICGAGGNTGSCVVDPNLASSLP